MTRACRREQSQSARLYLDCFSVFCVRVRHDLCVAPCRTVPSGSAQVRLRTAYAGALPIATSQPTRYQNCMFPTTSNLSFPVHITTRVTELSENGKASRRKWQPSCHGLTVVFVVRRSPWVIVLCRAIKPIESGGDLDSLRSIGT